MVTVLNSKRSRILIRLITNDWNTIHTFVYALVTYTLRRRSEKKPHHTKQSNSSVNPWENKQKRRRFTSFCFLRRWNFWVLHIKWTLPNVLNLLVATAQDLVDDFKTLIFSCAFLLFCFFCFEFIDFVKRFYAHGSISVSVVLVEYCAKMYKKKEQLTMWIGWCMYIRNKVHGIQERNHVNHSILAPELKTSKRMNNSFVHKANNPIIITIMMVVSTTETDIAPYTKIFLSSLTCLRCFLSTKTEKKLNAL